MSSALLDSLAGAFAGDAARRELLDAALRDGLPPARSEAWKYTSLRALERRAFAPAVHAPIDSALLAQVPAPRLVFVNGRFDAALSQADGLPPGVTLRPFSQLPAATGETGGTGRLPRADDVFARLNAALADEGAVVRAEENASSDAPLHLVFVGAPADGDRAWHARHRVELHRGARLTLVEHHLAAGDHAHLGNALTQVRLASGATLVHARVQDESARATLFARTDVVLASDASYRRIDLELGAALSRHELNVRLEGNGARALANGVLLGTGRRHVDTRLGIEHVARDTACDLLWRGLAAGRGRVVFHGGITIHAGADGSDATLANKNLLLSDQAEIDTQPVLEIHADEVKAAHGAAVGQLDPTAMFYLRSRGLPEAQARRLLTDAFGREALSVIGEPALREALLQALGAGLARLEAA
ncbi:MAG: Fe-S cluster assembly protein SufD [Lysobacter sp.]|nr:Fe-S cluster assembly protein SufD [Lysobacter sp.]